MVMHDSRKREWKTARSTHHLVPLDGNSAVTTGRVSAVMKDDASSLRQKGPARSG